jgi:hypothetical protein
MADLAFLQELLEANHAGRPCTIVRTWDLTAGPLIPNSALLCATAMDERATLQARIRAAGIDLLRRNRGALSRDRKALPIPFSTLIRQDASCAHALDDGLKHLL